MPTVIVDIARWTRAAGRPPPKKGQVVASFMVGGTVHQVSGWSFEDAVNRCKRLHARPAGVHTIELYELLHG